jgi:3-oxoacyl-[acyl-carrier protein] reductase
LASTIAQTDFPADDRLADRYQRGGSMTTIAGTTLITGASRGIGLALARHLAEEGHEIVGLARSEPPEGFAGTFYRADLADAADTARALERIAGRHRVLRLVNNAGLFIEGYLDKARIEDFERMAAINLRAPLQAIQTFAPAMREARFGRIVNIGSRAALGKPGRMIYGATKAAIVGMTRTAALELAGDGITVNCIAPGPVETELFAENNPPDSDLRRRFVANIPVGRVGAPEDIAVACAYFLDVRAGFTTGQVLNVCGGMSIGLAGL